MPALQISYKVEADHIIFLKLIPIFSKFFSRYLPSCLYMIGHRYWYFKICLLMYCRYFNKSFWFKLIWIAYSLNLQQP